MLGALQGRPMTSQSLVVVRNPTLHLGLVGGEARSIRKKTKFSLAKILLDSFFPDSNSRFNFRVIFIRLKFNFLTFHEGGGGGGRGGGKKHEKTRSD
jgi:hypothetical protein